MASYMSVFKYLEIQLEDIKSATNNFHDSRFIGSGGFGNVYKGKISHSKGKLEVAFKRLDRKRGQGDPEFFKEIRMLSSYKHDNLISLLGYCNEGNEMILMYEYASRGSLERILNDADLMWKQRLKICLGAAKGLSFLHDPKGTQQRILHRDIKSANILLDENLNAKVADFGLSKISPANQKFTFVVTSPVGTPGYCDPLYMDAYQLTKESDVYSFGVVLFEVLCGRVCYEHRDGNFKVFVNDWKRCYEEKKLDEIIFPDIKNQLDPSSVEIFADIAYQCLQKTREQRPTMSVVVEKLRAALKLKELHDLKLQREHEQKERKAAEYDAEEMRKAAEYAYKEILKAADPPLRFLKFPVNKGKTQLLINDKGEVIRERIYIEACLDRFQYVRLKDPSGFENKRFPGGRCYYKDERELKLRVKAQFLYPGITYSVNIVFKNSGYLQRVIHYKLDGETKCCMVYDTYKRKDGWFVVPLHQFTSDHKIAHFEINFERFRIGCELRVAGFEFQLLEEKVELRDQGLEEYQDIAKATSQTLFYKSLEELKKLLSMGFHINNHTKWFSLNENGQHCEMLSIAHCLISPEGGNNFYRDDDLYSCFPSGIYHACFRGFKVHIRAQFLTPLIDYTVKLVLSNRYSKKQMYVDLRYTLEGEKETSIVYFATRTKDNRYLTAELYQFTSNGKVFDLEIVFLDHKNDLLVEGILFQPLQKVEHEQVLEDDELSNDNLRWTMRSNFFKWFMGTGQKGYAVDNNGKKSLIFSARRTISSHTLSFMSSPESRFSSPEARFGEVAVIKDYSFKIEKKIKSDVLSPETTYAIYLIYKVPQVQSDVLSPKYETTYATCRIYRFKGLLQINFFKGCDLEYPYIYIVSPPETPFIGPKLDENTHNHLNGPKLENVPRQRSDGWMEVKVGQFQTRSSTETIHLDLNLSTPDGSAISRLLNIESIEIRPIVRHSV